MLSCLGPHSDGVILVTLTCHRAFRLDECASLAVSDTVTPQSPLLLPHL